MGLSCTKQDHWRNKILRYSVTTSVNWMGDVWSSCQCIFILNYFGRRYWTWAHSLLLVRLCVLAFELESTVIVIFYKIRSTVIRISKDYISMREVFSILHVKDVWTLLAVIQAYEIVKQVKIAAPWCCCYMRWLIPSQKVLIPRWITFHNNLVYPQKSHKVNWRNLRLVVCTVQLGPPRVAESDDIYWSKTRTNQTLIWHLYHKSPY